MPVAVSPCRIFLLQNHILPELADKRRALDMLKVLIRLVSARSRSLWIAPQMILHFIQGSSRSTLTVYRDYCRGFRVERVEGCTLTPESPIEPPTVPQWFR